MYVHGFTSAQLAIGQPFQMVCQLLKETSQPLLLLNILIQLYPQEKLLLQLRPVPN